MDFPLIDVVNTLFPRGRILIPPIKRWKKIFFSFFLRSSHPIKIEASHPDLPSFPGVPSSFYLCRRHLSLPFPKFPAPPSFFFRPEKHRAMRWEVSDNNPSFPPLPNRRFFSPTPPPVRMLEDFSREWSASLQSPPPSLSTSSKLRSRCLPLREIGGIFFPNFSPLRVTSAYISFSSTIFPERLPIFQFGLPWLVLLV